MESRLDNPAPERVAKERSGDAVGRVNPSNGQDGLPDRSVRPREDPVSASMTAGTSFRKRTEVT